MTNKLFLILVLSLTSSGAVLAATAEEEKAFVDGYKAAFEAGDKAKLESYLYTQGANPMALEFYKAMQLDGAGGKVSKIELVNLTPEDAKKASETQDGPGGQKFRLPLKPTKKLMITIERQDDSGSSSGSSGSFVAEKDGKFVIPVPVDAK